MVEKKSYKVDILGVNYQLLTDNEDIEDIVKELETSVLNMKEHSLSIGKNEAMTFVALNLIESNRELKKELDLYKKDTFTSVEVASLMNEIDELNNKNDKLIFEQQTLLNKIDRLNSTNIKIEDELVTLKTMYEASEIREKDLKVKVSKMKSELTENTMELVKARKTLINIDDK